LDERNSKGHYYYKYDEESGTPSVCITSEPTPHIFIMYRSRGVFVVE
jgi:hypothetical protein